MLGSLGTVVFEVSDQRVRTFQEIKREGPARFATHEVLGRKPVKEFIGPGVESISFSVRFDVFLGLNPAEELAALREMRDKGEPVELIVRDKPVSENLWVLVNLSETWRHIDNKGSILVAEAELSLEEYYREPEVTDTAEPAEGEANEGGV